ncbi:MAG TPA: trans-aconitate 2-methyltransferase [Propionibacteriaceae bacterium]|nr:trans-aconitate 2-methyltransferase [Propionibacteriaceae bacterium]
MASWDPMTYLRFSDERSRPFFDLVARIGASAPTKVVDMGCGPGQLTARLADRWPETTVVGIDSSPDMIATAREHASSRVQFVLADLRSWRPLEPVDVLLSNATLQWVPDHRGLLPRFLDFLAGDGWLAFQVPGNFDEPSHRLLRELATEPRFASATRAVEWPASAEPSDYLSDLAALGCQVDAWETTYLHVLEGPDAVFDWISGTGARPVLDALVGDERAAFVREYKTRLRKAYPAQSYGTVLPFRRIFVVAQLTRTGS